MLIRKKDRHGIRLKINIDERLKLAFDLLETFERDAFVQENRRRVLLADDLQTRLLIRSGHAKTFDKCQVDMTFASLESKIDH